LAKPEWGTKRICQSCAAKFYDFGRAPIVCPKCSTVFDPEILLKSRRSRPAPTPKPVKPIKPVKPVDPSDDELEEGDDLADLPDDDEDEPVIEDASDLGEDDEEMSKVVVPGGEEE
jgi:uncharacterized protein (TIGR02300 family)